ncbi:class I tRNA ligase family protein, partial [Oceanobacillus oncorhynchi]
GKETPEDVENWEQDEDVLDTWFSSALWPFSTMGWPNEESADLKRYFPTNVLVTGYDIIFFWVSRMIFQSKEFMNERPFEDTLLHGLIRDAEGRKMSKSLGNGVDPMDVIDKYGADSLRYFLMTGSTPGQDLRFHWERIESTWNFANKVWNASRFSLMNMEGFQYEDIDLTGDLTVADRWILSRLNETIDHVTRNADKYEFGEAGRYLYNFIWDEFCDWYIEMAKLALYGEDEAKKNTTRSVLAHVLDQTMRMLHPFMPFITEEIWQQLPHEGASITVSEWPKVNPAFDDKKAVSEMQRLVAIIKSVRNSRAEVDTPMSKQIEILISAENEELVQELEKNREYLERFCNPSSLQIAEDIAAPDKAMTSVVTGAEIFLPLEGLIDFDKEIARLENELAKWNKEVERVQKKLSNQGFISKAPESLVEEEKQKEKDYLDKQAKVKARLAELKQ